MVTLVFDTSEVVDSSLCHDGTHGAMLRWTALAVAAGARVCDDAADSRFWRRAECLRPGRFRVNANRAPYVDHGGEPSFSSYRDGAYPAGFLASVTCQLNPPRCKGYAQPLAKKGTSHFERAHKEKFWWQRAPLIEAALLGKEAAG